MHIQFSGLDNIPPTGGCILATNHLSRLDTPLILMAVERNDLSALVTDKYRNNPLFALFVDVSDSIWINRDIADYKAIRAGLDHIKSGGILGNRSRRHQEPEWTTFGGKKWCCFDR